jgi:hypothetical protein
VRETSVRMVGNAEKGKEMSTPVCVRSDLLEKTVNVIMRVSGKVIAFNKNTFFIKQNN